MSNLIFCFVSSSSLISSCLPFLGCPIIIGLPFCNSPASELLNSYDPYDCGMAADGRGIVNALFTVKLFFGGVSYCCFSADAIITSSFFWNCSIVSIFGSSDLLGNWSAFFRAGNGFCYGYALNTSDTTSFFGASYFFSSGFCWIGCSSFFI